MTDQEVTQEQLEQLIDDVSYLGDEAEALQYVIDRVPYSEDPQEGRSIYNTLKLIDHAQKNYYRPIIELVFSENRMVDLSRFEYYEETFQLSEDDDKDVQKALRKIVKHRAALLNTVEKIPLIDWERGVKENSGRIITLFHFVQGMVKQERKHLKEIADLILLYQNEKMAQKEINAKARNRQNN